MSKFKSAFEVEIYLLVLNIRKYRASVTKFIFHCSNHATNVEIGKQKAILYFLGDMNVANNYVEHELDGELREKNVAV